MKLLSLALIAGLASAQTQDLNATLAGNSQLSSLSKLLAAFPQFLSQVSSLQNVTLLAPNNAAIAAVQAQLAGDLGLAQATLQYHVLKGTIMASDITATPQFVPTMLTNASFTNVTGGQVVEASLNGKNVTFTSYLTQNSTVVQGDIAFTGGVVHVIDKVLTIPQNTSAWDAVANFTSLTTFLDKAGALPGLDIAKDVTIFAPLNTGFDAVNSTLSGLSQTDLASVMNYHVINGTVAYSTALKDGLQLTTANGANLTVHFEKGGIFINGAKIMATNILASDGTWHVIDNVLNPNSTSAPAASATAGSVAFSSASGSATTSAAGGGATSSGSASASGSAAASGSSGLAAPMQTGAMGAAALFGAGAALLNM